MEDPDIVIAGASAFEALAAPILGLEDSRFTV